MLAARTTVANIAISIGIRIIQPARALDYYANTSSYRAWVRLVLRNTN